MMWWEGGKSIERNAENTFYAFPLLAAGCDRGLRFISRIFFCAIFLFNNSLRQHCGCNFCRLQCNFNTRQSSLWARPQCEGVLSRFSTKLPPIAQLLRAKGKKERKMIYWRKGKWEKFFRTRFADDSTRQVFSIMQSLPNSWGIRELFEQKKGRERARKWGMEKKVGSEEMGGEGWQRVHGGIFLHRLKPPPQALPRFTAGI